ncbi:MAG: hypothetical protein AUI13_13975 [Gemmatimonadetes bacterium 13_2_20CM_2_69_23]|nr:MAG: hypothetical protein AUI13_13975 [Gemmatimonadetes bacterium 13_2_20CM_2_69_23]
MLVLIVLASVSPPVPVSAQGVFNQFSSENLRPSALQFDFGPLGGNNIRGTITGGLRLDYGFVAPKVRVLLGLSYFHADLSSQALRRYADGLRRVVNDPDQNYTIQLGNITWSDLTGDLDLQYVMPQGHAVTTYIGLGVGVHLRNGRGTAINGTFVEDALDQITAGLNGTLGAEFGAKRWRVTLDARGVLSSGLSTVSLRTGVMYRWTGMRAGRSPGR